MAAARLLEKNHAHHRQRLTKSVCDMHACMHASWLMLHENFACHHVAWTYEAQGTLLDQKIKVCHQLPMGSCLGCRVVARLYPQAACMVPLGMQVS
jgi:hypothetical protein